MNYGNSESLEPSNFLYNCLLFSKQRWLLNPVKICTLFLLLTLSETLLLTGTISLSHSPRFEAIFEGFHLSPSYTLVYSFPPSLLSSWILPYVACKIFISFWEHGSLNHCALRNKDLQEKPYFTRRTHGSEAALPDLRAGPSSRGAPRNAPRGCTTLLTCAHPGAWWAEHRGQQWPGQGNEGQQHTEQGTWWLANKQRWPNCAGEISRSMDKNDHPH